MSAYRSITLTDEDGDELTIGQGVRDDYLSFRVNDTGSAVHLKQSDLGALREFINQASLGREF